VVVEVYFVVRPYYSFTIFFELLEFSFCLIKSYFISSFQFSVFFTAPATIYLPKAKRREVFSLNNPSLFSQPAPDPPTGGEGLASASLRLFMVVPK